MRIRMMRGAALVLALVMLLSLCGCGEEDPYSAAMRAGEEQGLFGQGDKVAVYNTKKGSYVRKYLQEEMLAASPEEVGFILSFSEQRNGLVSFVLMDAADGTEISNAGYSRKTLSTEGGRYASVVSWVRHRSDSNLKSS